MLHQKLVQGFTCTDSTKKSEAAFNHSATVRRRSGWENTSAAIMPIKIIFTMALQTFLWIKTQISNKKNLKFKNKRLIKISLID